MCSTTSAAVKRADRAHKPVSGPAGVAATSSQPGASEAGSFQPTAPSRAVPMAKPTAMASSRQRPWSSVGVREWSFFVLVASEASSSACIRNAGDWYSAPLASSSASTWTLRLENARSCSRLKPSISLVF
jgi:hypothetical protein